MRRGRQLGLDELMIVNPSLPDSGAVFLGRDGTLYQVQGLGEEERLQGLGQFFLGEDNTLYQVLGLGRNAPAEFTEVSAEGMAKDEGQELGRFFLGEDGTLYELVRKRR